MSGNKVPDESAYIIEGPELIPRALSPKVRRACDRSGKRTEVQIKRAEVLFRLYPDIMECYDRYLELIDIYNLKTDHRPTLMTKLARLYDRVWQMGLKCFNTVLQMFMNNYPTILNFFDNRSTNASAESFNAKVKAFRAQFRGVRDIPFFIFRLAKIFA